MNRKGDIPTILYVTVAIFIIGIILFFGSHLNNQLYNSLDNYFGNSATYNDSEARDALQSIQTKENNLYDYVFLIVVIFGYVPATALSAYATRISPLFFWIYGVLSLVGLATGVMLSNAWQTAVANPEFATTLTRFPITNLLLGSYYPTFVTGLIVLTMIFLFGKNPNEGLQ